MIMAAPYDSAKLFQLTVKHLQSAITLIECCFTEIDLWEHTRLALRLYVWAKSATVGQIGWTVDPNYRKQGIASKLIDHIGAIARERSLELRVMTFTRKYPIAARLYESRGIHIVEMPL